MSVYVGVDGWVMVGDVCVCVCVCVCVGGWVGGGGGMERAAPLQSRRGVGHHLCMHACAREACVDHSNYNS